MITKTTQTTQTHNRKNNMTNKPLCEIGVLGLGVMGKNLLLNMADKGFQVTGYDKDPEKNKAFQDEQTQPLIHFAADIKAFIELLKVPRSILLLVPAGPIVDSAIQELLPYLQKGDLIIDAGNSYFKDTDLRTIKLAANGFQFLGMGVSGGEEGARFGPSMMPGGTKEAYNRIRLILEAIAAKADQEPCVTYLGPGSSGHFVKMIHNGIEYGIMQLIAESYDFMKRGLGLNDDKLRDVYLEWNKSELNSYLIEITGHIFDRMDDKTGKKLIDVILDVAKQKGTGMWTTETAMELQVPAPTIDAAVAMRDLSVFVKERSDMNAIYQNITSHLHDKITNDPKSDPESWIKELKNALYVAMIVVYSQGMTILNAASKKYQYHLKLEDIAKIWRGGCIIRAALLNDFVSAYKKDNQLSNLLLDPDISRKVIRNQQSLRVVIAKAISFGLPTPGLMASLSYLDGFRSNWLPSNLIQAQRDYFGSHTYERMDRKGSFHTEWEKK